MLDQVQVREANDTDRNLILSSILKSYRISVFSQDIPNEVYYIEHEARLKKVLSKSNVVILCNSQQQNIIYGFVVFEEFSNYRVVHALYIKKSFRNFRLAAAIYEQILKGKTLFYTHNFVTIDGKGKRVNTGQILAKKVNAIYNPYLFFI